MGPNQCEIAAHAGSFGVERVQKGYSDGVIGFIGGIGTVERGEFEHEMY